MSKIKLIGSAIGCGGAVIGCELSPNLIAANLDSTMISSHVYNYTGRRNDTEQLHAYFTQIAESIRTALVNDKFVLSIGGDHSLAIGSWSGVASYLQDQQQELGLIWIDAHMDAHTPDTTPSNNLHGMPVAHLLGEAQGCLSKILTSSNKLRPENIVYFGLRSYENAEESLLDRLGVKRYYIKDLTNDNFTQLFQAEYNRLAKTTRLGISLDLDGLDPSLISAVGTPVENGIDAHVFLECLNSLDFNKLVAFEIAEFNPLLDESKSSLRYILDIIKVLEAKLSSKNIID